MDDLRWILLAVVVIVVAAVYFFSRSRKKETYEMPLNEINDVPSFSASNDASAESVTQEWVDGVGPVRVLSASDDSSNAPEIAVKDYVATEAEILEVDPDVSVRESTSKVADNSPSESFKTEKTIHDGNMPKDNVSDEIFPENNLPEESLPQESLPQEAHSEQSELPVKSATSEKHSEPDSEDIDDVVSVYVLAPENELINGDKILSASYALQLDYGEMKIFHRHTKTPDRKIEFSMANVQQPGWFEIDSMNDMKTTGVSFFMQVNLVDSPSSVLDEMLICAHSLSTMLGARLCNAQRKLLDEVSTTELREKVKRLEAIKAQTV